MMDISEVLRAEREAKQKIARRLHHGLIQSLATVAMRAGLSRRMAASDPEKAIQEISVFEGLARKAAIEARYLLFELDPSPLENEGLAATLREWVRQYQELYGIQVSFSDEVGSRLPSSPDFSFLVFSTLVEVCDSLAKQGETQEISITLRLDSSSQIHASVGYSGREQAELIQDRIEYFGGRLESSSSKDGNQQLEFWLPVGATTGKHDS